MITINASKYDNNILEKGEIYEITNVKMLENQGNHIFYASEDINTRGAIFTAYQARHYTGTTTVYIDLRASTAYSASIYTEGD